MIQLGCVKSCEEWGCLGIRSNQVGSNQIKCYGDDGQFVCEHKGHLLSIDRFIISRGAADLYALFEYGLTLLLLNL